jgi:hypothetical protein
MRASDLGRERLVVDGPARGRPATPGEVPARGDAEQAAQQGHRVIGLLSLDEPVHR